MMIKVHACGKTREYPEGTPLFTVAEEFQPEFRGGYPAGPGQREAEGAPQDADEGVPDRISDLSGSGGEKDV